MKNRVALIRDPMERLFTSGGRRRREWTHGTKAVAGGKSSSDGMQSEKDGNKKQTAKSWEISPEFHSEYCAR
jgi:hypothetical protein